MPFTGLNSILTDFGTGAVPPTRLINTTLPLTGGGDLSADRTLSINDFTAIARGTVPASGGGTTNFLRADGTWTAPTGTTHNLLSATHPDTLVDSVVQGDVIFGNATPKWARLAANATATNKYLRSVSGGVPSWQQVAAADVTPPGADTQVIFNNSGAFSASANLAYDYTNVRLGIGGAPNEKLQLQGTGTQRLFVTETSTPVTCAIIASAAAGFFGTRTNHSLFMQVNALNRGLIDTAGYFSLDPAGVTTATTLITATESKALGASPSDDYAAALTLKPAYTGAFTVTRHNYIDLNNVTGTSTITDAAVMRFNAAAGTHKAVDSGTTKSTPGTVDAWVKVNINGTIYYLPAYTSKTT